MNKTKKEIALPNNDTVIDWTGVIPIVIAENIPIASPTPKLAGVIAITTLKYPTDNKNKHFEMLMSIPNTWNDKYVLITAKTVWIRVIEKITKITLELSFIKCHPFNIFINLFIKLFFVSGNFGEKIIITKEEINTLVNTLKEIIGL